jgi:preprotein translocase SecE subunit
VKDTITPDRERLNVANKMADKKRNASQSEAAAAKVRGREKEQSQNVKAETREREERKEREIKESKPVKHESKQPSGTQGRFRNLRNNRFVRFVREAYHELRYKVTWPTFQQARTMTIVVIALSAAVSIILGIADLGLTRLFLFITSR